MHICCTRRFSGNSTPTIQREAPPVQSELYQRSKSRRNTSRLKYMLRWHQMWCRRLSTHHLAEELESNFRRRLPLGSPYCQWRKSIPLSAILMLEINHRWGSTHKWSPWICLYQRWSRRLSWCSRVRAGARLRRNTSSPLSSRRRGGQMLFQITYHQGSFICLS